MLTIINISTKNRIKMHENSLKLHIRNNQRYLINLLFEFQSRKMEQKQLRRRVGRLAQQVKCSFILTKTMNKKIQKI